uniref:Cytochrome c oxidase subunit 2 n=1 Tax=Geryonia proboscidalis TaxID=497503 RepID=A0A0S2IBA3_9CNID|nr:cytochrome c oxidase subunit 2 [Geryonia proboscidalis]
MNNILYTLNLYKDGVEHWQLAFQDSASPIHQELVLFHDYIMFILTIILFVVGWLIIKALVNQNYYKFLVDGTTIELVWTMIPAVVLIFIAFPSLQLLYTMDEIIEPSLTIKAVGHQWYWSYEYSDYDTEPLEFDSYMVPTSDLEQGDMRLLEVDNRVVIPINTHVRVLITGADVIHSWTVPSLGVKADAVPGRLNQVSFFLNRPGVFYGQCSEICGSEHSFMPIVVEGVSLDKFVHWISEKIEENE